MLTLTADDVRAFKDADRVVVSCKGETADVRLIKRIRAVKRGPFESEEREVDRTVVCNTHSTQLACFVALYPGGQFQALAKLVKTGDALFFSARENGNQYTKDAGLFHDQLLVTVGRGSKQIIREMVLDDSVTPNNSARALRGA